MQNQSYVFSHDAGNINQYDTSLNSEILPEKDTTIVGEVDLKRKWPYFCIFLPYIFSM